MSTAQRFTSNRKQRVRTLWISDVHLGTRDCQAEHLAAFLKRYHADRIYLVGDIIDGWKLRGGIYWPQAHTNVIRRLLTLSKRGTEVIYVTGNHDEFLRRYSSLILGNIRLVDEAVHSTADGRKLLVIHGDQFDVITRYHRWLAFLGDSAYEFTLLLNRWLNHWRRRWGYGYWSLSAYLKHKVKTAVNFISDFEEAIAHECHKRGLDGVVCGHIHHAEIRRIEGVDYLNCGDWVESCTALIEHWDGSIQALPPGRGAGAAGGAGRGGRAGGMRLLIVSDAWLPQVNGVVTSLLALQREPGTAGPPGTGAVARRLPLPALSQLSGNPPGLEPLAPRRVDRGLRPGCRAPGHRGAARLGRAALAGQARPGLHLGDPYALSRIPA